MPGELGFSIRDNNGDVTSTGIHTGEVTAISIPGLLVQVGQLRTALEGVTLGVMAAERLSVFNTKLSALRAASTIAQVETKWVVGYHDNTAFFDDPVNAIPNAGYQKPFTFEIGTADYSLLDDGSESLDITTALAPGTVLKTVLEATARSPYGGEIIVDYIRVMS
jgi:hypothetical protein